MNTPLCEWQHSLETATVARVIVLREKLPHARVEAAFLAAMLHDVGRVVFATRDAFECSPDSLTSTSHTHTELTL